MTRSSAILLACSIAAFPTASIAADAGLSANMLQGEAAIGREDYSVAAQCLTAECNNGGATGCYDLAVLEHEGLAGPRNLARAAELNRRACDLGNDEGCANLGTQLLTGDGVPPDRRKAARLLERSCRKESPTGCFGLALLYEGQFGGKADTNKAETALEKACRVGHGEACYRRGHQLAQIVPNKSEFPMLHEMEWQMASTWYSDACAAGNAAGCNALGVLASEGKGSPVNGETAYRYFTEACEKGSATGCINLGKLLDEGKLIPAAAALARAAAIESGQSVGQP